MKGNDKLYINGPLNIITLYNPKMNKYVSTFADYHEDPKNETKCLEKPSVNLVDFVKVKLEKAKDLDSQLHLFIETIPANHPDDIQNEIRNGDMRYADKLIDFLLTNFQKPYNIDDGISKSSNNYPNVVLHFIDIRNLIFLNMDYYFKAVSEKSAQLNIGTFDNPKILSELENLLTVIYGMMKFTYDVFYSMNIQESKELFEAFLKLTDDGVIQNNEKEKATAIAIKLTIQKIKNSYKNDDVKNAMQKYIEGSLKKNFEKFFSKYLQIKKFINNLKESIKDDTKRQRTDIDGGIIYVKPYLEMAGEQKELDKLLYEFNHLWFVELTSKIMDLYMVRIILDKDIKYAVTFTGIEHSMFLVHFLINYFDFKIEGVSRVNDISVDELTKIIKTSENKEFHKYLFPKEFMQCSANDGFTIF